MSLEEVEEADGETETENGSEEIFSMIKLDVQKMSAGDGSKVFADEEVEEEEYIEVYVSSDEDEEEDDDSD